MARCLANLTHSLMAPSASVPETSLSRTSAASAKLPSASKFSTLLITDSIPSPFLLCFSLIWKQRTRDEPNPRENKLSSRIPVMVMKRIEKRVADFRVSCNENMPGIDNDHRPHQSSSKVNDEGRRQST